MSSRSILSFCLTVTRCVVVVALLAPPATAVDELNQKIPPVLQSLHEEASRSVVNLRNQDGVGCLGVLVAKNLVMSKRSELSGIVTCVGHGGARASAVLVGYSPALDIALVEVLPTEQHADSFANAIRMGSPSSVVAGDLLFSVGGENKPGSVGMATVDPQSLPIKQPRCRDCVDLGLSIARQAAARQLKPTIRAVSPDLDPPLTMPEPDTIYGANVKRVYPRTVGERVGVLQGDLLVSVNGQPVHNAASLRSVGRQVRVGQRVNVVVVRDGQLKSLTGSVEQFSRRVYHDRWGGGPFSDRRFGFATVIIHDTLLKPAQCGGPLLNLDGELLGINISRSLRVATFAIPVAQLREFVQAVRPGVLPQQDP